MDLGPQEFTLGQLAVILGIGGLLVTSWGAYKVLRGLGTRDWKAAPGQVSAATVSGPEELTEEERRKLNAKGFYKPRVSYTYTLHGREYEGDVLQEGLFGLPFRSLADKQVAAFEPGQQVTVYVSPRNVRQAVLVRGAPAQAFVLLACGVGLLVVAFICY